MLITCPNCDHEIEISPGSLLGKGKKKTMTDAAIAARKANAQKPRKRKQEAPNQPPT